ncbi:hypothetical protein E3A20_29320 [Planctomyces bekefii]|uniref:Iron transporter n=1 Tax=Planctomyces bekefii TaxID=1653850 RepID=A0A5C6LZD1_9PLAN|nr:hypothetical protein E3A20_29320 [Planctomyces bekefii]
MPPAAHVEKHFSGSAVVRDIVIGMSDGLTVPFALAAGLSGAVAETGLIVTAGLAEIAAGAVAMGLGGFLAARTEMEHYRSELSREQRETVELPEVEAEEVAEIFREYGLQEPGVEILVKAIRSDQKRWVNFMMKFELGMERPEPKRAYQSAVAIGGSYVCGGLVPLTPYFYTNDPILALKSSVALTVLALFAFGFAKGKITKTGAGRGAIQTLAVGGLAALVAFLIARWVG